LEAGNCSLLCGSNDSLVAIIIWLLVLASGFWGTQSALKIQEMLEESWPRWPARSAFLRQHYLDQVLGSPAFRAELSAFVVPADGRLAPRLLPPE
jgi:hypothetical protein